MKQGDRVKVTKCYRFAGHYDGAIGTVSYACKSGTGQNLVYVNLDGIGERMFYADELEPLLPAGVRIIQRASDVFGWYSDHGHGEEKTYEAAVAAAKGKA